MKKVRAWKEKQNKWEWEARKKAPYFAGCFTNWATTALLKRLVGKEIGWIDTDARSHTHTHIQKKRERQSYTHTRKCLRQAFICCFPRQIRLSCAQAKQKRWWPALKSSKRASTASPSAVLWAHKDASQWDSHRRQKDVYFVRLTGFFCAIQMETILHTTPQHQRTSTQRTTSKRLQEALTLLASFLSSASAWTLVVVCRN